MESFENIKIGFVIYSIQDREPIEIDFEKNWEEVRRA